MARGKRGPKSPILNAVRDARLSEDGAVAFFEHQRWGDDPACPRCGSTNVYAMKNRDGERNKNYRWRCKETDCKPSMFTVRTGTIMEESRLSLRIWVDVLWRSCASKKGVSALQISREHEISYTTALYLMKRVRKAMAIDHDTPAKLTGTVEADETYVGGKPRYRIPYSDPNHLAKRRAADKKSPVFAVVQRGGEVRASTVATVNKANLGRELRRVVDLKNARLITDESPVYTKVGPEFSGGHETVNHRRREYVRGDVTTNTIEGFFSLIKRGVYGTFHSVSKAHLHRYVSEFEFRYNTRNLDDGERVSKAIQGCEGKRLTYSDSLVSRGRS